MNSSLQGLGEFTRWSTIIGTLRSGSCFFSSPTCSVAFPSQDRPASSMIEVIKKVDIIWKLISVDYAKRIKQKHLWWHLARIDVDLHGDSVIRVMANWRRALNCYVILGWDGCQILMRVCACVGVCARTFISHHLLQHIPTRRQYVNIFYD